MACKGEIPLDKFTEVETTYTIVFNKRANVEKKKKVQTVDWRIFRFVIQFWQSV